MSKNITELIEAAEAAGIVSSLKREGRYISFAIDSAGGKRHYELCLEGDPSAEHPSAERAMRASDAVMDIYTRLNETYNCFAVSMANIEPPTGAELARILGVDSSVKVSEPRGEAVDRFSGEVTHMIQVVIDIFIGDSIYDTVIDNVYVNCHTDPVSGGRVCLFKSAGEKVFDTNETVLDKKGDTIEADKMAARTLLSELTGKNVSRTYQGVLKALSEDKASNFYKYLDGVAKTKPRMPVGRIEMRIRSLYLGAEKVKQFVYTLSSRDGYSQDVKLFWNKSSRLYDKGDKLYLITEGERFVGVTCERPEAGAVEFKRDVIYAKTPAMGEDGKYRLEPIFFPRSMLKVRGCEYCHGSYYASDATDRAYRECFTLLDGSHGCEVCTHENYTVKRNRKKYKYRARAKRLSDAVSGGFFTEYEEIGGDVLVDIEKGGNAFKCSHCGLFVYKNTNIKNEDIHTCEICGEYVCNECYREMSISYRAYNGTGADLPDVVFCNTCAKDETVEYNDETLKLYTAYTDYTESEECFVLDDAERSETGSLELCGECGKYIYTAKVPMPEDGRCVKCGAYLGRGCLEVARGRLDNGNSLCGACMNLLKNQDLRKLFLENLKLKTEYEYTDMRLSSIRKYLESALYILPFIERHKEFIKRHMGILAAIKFGGATARLVGGIAFRLKDENLLDKPDPCVAELEYRLEVRVGRACRRFIIKADAMLSQIENGACQVDITRERVVYGG